MRAYYNQATGLPEQAYVWTEAWPINRDHRQYDRYTVDHLPATAGRQRVLRTFDHIVLAIGFSNTMQAQATDHPAGTPAQHRHRLPGFSIFHIPGLRSRRYKPPGHVGMDSTGGYLPL